MVWFGVATLSLALCYAWVQIRLSLTWDKLPSPSDKLEPVPNLVSILVPARNEAGVIEECLKSILKQTYPGRYEVICLDNHSTDNTVAEASHIKDDRLRIVELANHRKEHETYKKEAIEFGVGVAKGSLIFLVDADCLVGENWLTAMVSGLVNENLDYITGPVVLTTDGSSFQGAYEQLDFAGLQILTAAGLSSGWLLSSNGANHGFRKIAFERANGYEGNESIRSGDDLFLLQKIVSTGGKASFVNSANAIVRTPVQASWREFLRQRIRWASKSGDLPHLSSKLITGLVFFNALALIASGVLAFYDHRFLIVFAIGLLLKVFADVWVLSRARRFFQLSCSLFSRWRAHFLNPFYILLVGFMAILRPSIRWKGRSI